MNFLLFLSRKEFLKETMLLEKITLDQISLNVILLRISNFMRLVK